MGCPAERDSSKEVIEAAETAKVEGLKRAAEIHGVPYSTIQAYVYRKRIPLPENDRTKRMNLVLSVMCAVAAQECPETPIPLKTIAEVCGVSKQAVAAIEFKAMKKLRNHPEIKPLIDHLER